MSIPAKTLQDEIRKLSVALTVVKSKPDAFTLKGPAATLTVAKLMQRHSLPRKDPHQHSRRWPEAKSSGLSIGRRDILARAAFKVP
jgi:hypothetical protein